MFIVTLLHQRIIHVIYIRLFTAVWHRVDEGQTEENVLRGLRNVGSANGQRRDSDGRDGTLGESCR